MTLTGKQKHQLRALAHHRKPVVIIGNAGLTDAVIKEINLALDSHELIKVKIPAAGRAELTSLVANICEACNAETVQTIGHIAVIYRPAAEPSIVLAR